MFVLRSKEGDKYYLIATDLKVSSMGWSQNQVNGSRKVEVYESTDMMNWTRTNARRQRRHHHQRRQHADLRYDLGAVQRD